VGWVNEHADGCKQAVDKTMSLVYVSCVHSGELKLVKVSVKEARENLRSLIDKAAAGEEIVLLRRGKEVARLVPPGGSRKKLPSLEAFRASLNAEGRSLSAEVVEGREKERY
jgi:prevent-host-death family protein